MVDIPQDDEDKLQKIVDASIDRMIAEQIFCHIMECYGIGIAGKEVTITFEHWEQSSKLFNIIYRRIEQKWELKQRKQDDGQADAS